MNLAMAEEATVFSFLICWYLAFLGEEVALGQNQLCKALKLAYKSAAL